MTSEIWTGLVDGQPLVSILVWIGGLVLVMYLARQPAHRLVMTLVRSIHRLLRLLAQSIVRAEQRLLARNRDILLRQGREQVERFIEREFRRIEAVVRSDLNGYPALHRDLKRQVARIDADYEKSSEIPPRPPAWLKAVDSVAQVPDNGSPAVGKILHDIHHTLKKSLDKDMQEYRKSNRDRHLLLKKMMPYWRTLASTLNSVEKKITGLEERSIVIDNQMQFYEEIRSQTDQAVLTLSTSAITQFFVSGLVLCVALVGMIVNFHLVEMPVQEMVGVASYMGNSSIRASDVAALFIVGIEVTLGLFLMESAGFTRLFPVVSQMDESRRRVLFKLLLVFLTVIAGVASSLVYMRDELAADQAAMSRLLMSAPVDELSLSWIPSMGQAVMGFVLPFVLAYVAIPFEMFLHAVRNMGGMMFAWLLNMLASLVRLVANLVYSAGRLTTCVYDLVIFLPLKIESLLGRRTVSKDASAAATSPVNQKQVNDA